MQWSRTTACRWDEVESVAGMLHVSGRCEPRQPIRILRLRTVDGRTLTLGGVRDMDELAEGRNIVVRRYGARGAWWSGDSETPNAALLLELAPACRRGELG